MSPPFTPTILRFDSLPSTNTEAARQASLGAREGLCVVAREQTAGRGRRELAAAVAVRDALEEACALRADIKWPNDLLASGRKLCGILAETAEGAAGRAVVLGVGINLTNRAFPPEILAAATSVEEQTGRAPDSEQLLSALTRQLARRYEELHADEGARAILREWEARSSYAHGRRVRVALAEETFDGIT